MAYNEIKNKCKDNERENDENNNGCVDELMSDIIDIVNKETELYNDVKLLLENRQKDEISVQK